MGRRVWPPAADAERRGREIRQNEGDPGRRATAGAPVSAGRRVGERGTSDIKENVGEIGWFRRMQFCLPRLHCSLPLRPGLAIVPRWRRRAALPSCVLKGSEPPRAGVMTGAEPPGRIRPEHLPASRWPDHRGVMRFVPWRPALANLQHRTMVLDAATTRAGPLPASRMSIMRHREQQQLLLLPACPF